MNKVQLSDQSPIGVHMNTLSESLDLVPELQPVIEMISSDPGHANDVYAGYLDLTTRMARLDASEYETIRVSQTLLKGEVGSASAVGANDLCAEVADKGVDLSLVAATSFDPRSRHYRPAVDELVSRMQGGHMMSAEGRTLSDRDPESLKVIWGHTVITGHEALLHFTAMHYLERFMAQALDDQGVLVAQQKDFFINAMTDVVVLRGLQNPDDPIFALWSTVKDQGGLGWITPDRLRSYTYQQ